MNRSCKSTQESLKNIETFPQGFFTFSHWVREAFGQYSWADGDGALQGQELDSGILQSPFQPSIFCDSVNTTWDPSRCHRTLHWGRNSSSTPTISHLFAEVKLSFPPQSAELLAIITPPRKNKPHGSPLSCLLGLTRDGKQDRINQRGSTVSCS